MKPNFKIDFSKRDFISMVCFSIVMILVLIFGNTFGFVSADGVNNFFSQSEYVSSSVYNSNNYFQGYIDDSNQYNASNSMVASNKIMSTDWSSIFTGSNTADVDTSTFKYYVITGSAYPSAWRVYFFTEDCYCFVGLNNLYYYTVILDSGSDFYYCDLTPYGTGTELQDPYVIFPDTLLHATANFDSGFGKYSVPFTLSQSNTICMTNMPILTYRSNESFIQGSYLNDLLAYNSGTTNVNVYNVNYLYDSEACPSLNGLDGLENVGGSYVPDSNETSENNLYMRDSKWSFSMPKWSNLTGYSGNATFSASLNDFQQENLNDFYLRFQFTIHTQLSYVSSNDPGNSGGGHGIDASDTGTVKTGYSSQIFDYKDSSTGNKYNDVTLQDFYNMGCSKAFMTLNGIFDRCYQKSLTGNSLDTNFASWYGTYSNSSKYTVTKAILYCYATLYDSSGNASGNCTYYYDLLNGTSGITDSGMSVNNNPYVDEDGNVEFDPGSSDSTTDNYTGNGVNVTQTVNVNNNGSSDSSKSWIFTLVSSLISSDDENITEAGMSDTLINLVGINPWIALMSSTFGFIPATVWTVLSLCFVVVMGILVVAFVLRIILDLL